MVCATERAHIEQRCTALAFPAGQELQQMWMPFSSEEQREEHTSRTDGHDGSPVGPLIQVTAHAQAHQQRNYGRCEESDGQNVQIGQRGAGWRGAGIASVVGQRAEDEADGDVQTKDPTLYLSQRKRSMCNGSPYPCVFRAQHSTEKGSTYGPSGGGQAQDRKIARGGLGF